MHMFVHVLKFQFLVENSVRNSSEIELILTNDDRKDKLLNARHQKLRRPVAAQVRVNWKLIAPSTSLSHAAAPDGARLGSDTATGLHAHDAKCASPRWNTPATSIRAAL